MVGTSGKFIRYIVDIANGWGNSDVIIGAIAAAILQAAVEHPEWAQAWNQQFKDEGAPNRIVQLIVQNTPISKEIPLGT